MPGSAWSSAASSSDTLLARYTSVAVAGFTP